MSRSEFRLSASRAKLFESCPAAYRFRYVARAPRGAPSVPMQVGSLVHKAIELHALAHPDATTISEIERFLPDTGIKYNAEVRAAADELVAKIKPVEVGRIIDVEARFDLDLGPFLLHGFIDLISGDPNGDIRIIDWKTGGAWPEDVEWDYQVGFYLVAAREMFPRAEKITVELHYVALGYVTHTDWTPERDAYFRRAAEAIYREIQAERFPARVGSACRWCDYRESCKAFAEHREKASRMEPSQVEELSLADLLEARQRYASAAKLLEDHRKELDERIKQEMGDKKRIEAGAYRATLVRRENKTANMNAVRAVADALGVEPFGVLADCAKISHSKLRKIAGESADATLALEQRTVRRPSISLQVREVKL